MPSVDSIPRSQYRGTTLTIAVHLVVKRYRDGQTCTAIGPGWKHAGATLYRDANQATQPQTQPERSQTESGTRKHHWPAPRRERASGWQGDWIRLLSSGHRLPLRDQTSPEAGFGWPRSLWLEDSAATVRYKAGQSETNKQERERPEQGGCGIGTGVRRVEWWLSRCRGGHWQRDDGGWRNRRNR